MALYGTHLSLNTHSLIMEYENMSFSLYLFSYTTTNQNNTQHPIQNTTKFQHTSCHRLHISHSQVTSTRPAQFYTVLALPFDDQKLARRDVMTYGRPRCGTYGQRP